MPISLLPDSADGVVRVAMQPPGIPNGSVEIAVCANSEISVSDGAVETEYDIIPTGSTVRLLMARASIQPVSGNHVRIEIYWKETIDSEDFYHLFGKTYLNEYNIECDARFPASSYCLDGHLMVGDETKDARLVIIREAFASGDDQDVFVALRGYYV